MLNKELYDMITNFSEKYGSVKFNNANNVHEYNKLVDKCIEIGTIPECNRKEYSTHGCLTAAITYEDNRYRFCTI